ncbi:SRPBCC domain-containing protein [Paenibacillus sp. CAA11]|uniref:SRPBCC family protein n=1 Tax=Paenibacillus sp. CAA11 TaxID=1532905 RepID=UPI000D3A3385|nr:SRPBCC domain-containing protein [Paenibacillus sp. CAA11]AWB44526.1 SRPBCC domain-containing protein [Paenibacillus sp. CAA11]
MTDSSKLSPLPEIRFRTTIASSKENVWQAVATAEGLGAWFMPNDLEPIEGYRFHLNAAAFGKSPCEVTEVESERRFAFRWGKDWTLAFEIEEAEGGTEVTLIHSGWDSSKSTEFGAPHTQVRETMEQGWSKLILALKSYVEK